MNTKVFLTQLTQLEYLYVIASLVVAGMILLEAGMLAKNGGKFPKSTKFAIVSLSTSAWLAVSAGALYFLEFDRFAISVPVIYGIYSVVGWFYGARLMGESGVPDSPDELIVPPKYLAFSQSFSVAFALLCCVMLVLPYWT